MTADASNLPGQAEPAAALRGFGPLGIIAILVILFSGNIFVGKVVVPAGAILVLAWMRWSRTPWRDIGYVRPRSWIAAVAAGVAFGVAFKFAMKALVMPLLGADPVNQAYHYLAGNRAMLPAAIWAMFAAGFGEETVFRGWFFERFGKIFGSSVAAKVAVVLITSAWFGISHYAVQGLSGTEQATIVGLVFGTIFAFAGRLFKLMCAHTAFDLTALAMIYWDVETDVAHLVFK
ncbi:MAG: CPBP family intramembrane glutamic endopeptidase [Acidobacteriota bacterium]